MFVWLPLRALLTLSLWFDYFFLVVFLAVLISAACDFFSSSFFFFCCPQSLPLPLSADSVCADPMSTILRGACNFQGLVVRGADVFVHDMSHLCLLI